MSYREHAPPAPWVRTVECIWTRDASPLDEEPAEYDVLPDGAMDVIATVYPDGTVANAFVVGAMTRPMRVASSPISYVGVRFYPGAGGSAIGVDAAELTDASVALADVLPYAAQAPDALRMLAHTPADARALHSLLTALRADPLATPPLLRRATSELARTTTTSPIRAVTKSLGISRQHLARLFATHVGLTPKQFSQICRVRALLAAYRRRPEGWSTLAATFGYSDQSHLIADVRAITGRTPGAWRDADGSIFPIAEVASIAD